MFVLISIAKYFNRNTTAHFLSNANYFKEDFLIFGNTACIRGINEDDINNNDWILTEIEKFDPEWLILGNTSYTDMEYYNHGSKKYAYPPLFESVNASQTFATIPMKNFFDHEFDINLGFYKEELDKDTIFQLDRKLKRKIFRPELSLCKIMNQKDDKKLFFGAPNPLFVTEDMVISHSLEEFKHIFYQSLDMMNDLWVKEKWAVVTEPTDFM